MQNHWIRMNQEIRITFTIYWNLNSLVSLSSPQMERKRSRKNQVNRRRLTTIWCSCRASESVYACCLMKWKINSPQLLRLWHGVNAHGGRGIYGLKLSELFPCWWCLVYQQAASLCPFWTFCFRLKVDSQSGRINQIYFDRLAACSRVQVNRFIEHIYEDRFMVFSRFNKVIWVFHVKLLTNRFRYSYLWSRVLFIKESIFCMVAIELQVRVMFSSKKSYS